MKTWGFTLKALILTLLVTACSQAPKEVSSTSLRPQFGTTRSDKATDVAINASGQLYTVGDNWDRGFVRRYNRAGTLLWQRTFNRIAAGVIGSYTYTSHFAEVDASGNVYLGVSNIERGANTLLKYDSSGALKWTKQIGDSVRGLALDAKGNVFVALGGPTGYVTKYSPGGVKLWERRGFAYPIAIDVSQAGNVHVVLEDGVIAKYSNRGTKLWGKSGSFLRGELPEHELEHFELAIGADEEIFVLVRLLAEVYNLECDCISYDGYLYLHKFDKTGARKWAKRVAYEGNPSSYPGGTSWGAPNLGLATDTKGNAFIAWPGPSSRARSDRNAFIAKYTRAGTRSWRKEFGTSETDGALSIATYDGSEVYTSGYSNVAPSDPYKDNFDAFLRKTDGGGNHLWTR